MKLESIEIILSNKLFRELKSILVVIDTTRRESIAEMLCKKGVSDELVKAWPKVNELEEDPYSLITPTTICILSPEQAEVIEDILKSSYLQDVEKTEDNLGYYYDELKGIIEIIKDSEELSRQLKRKYPESKEISHFAHSSEEKKYYLTRGKLVKKIKK